MKLYYKKPSSFVIWLLVVFKSLLTVFLKIRVIIQGVLEDYNGMHLSIRKYFDEKKIDCFYESFESYHVLVLFIRINFEL